MVVLAACRANAALSAFSLALPRFQTILWQSGLLATGGLHLSLLAEPALLALSAG